MFLDCLTYSLFIPGKNIHLKQSQSLWIRQSSILCYQLQYRNTHIFHIFIAYCYMVRIVYISKVVVPRCFIYLQLSRLFGECLREYFTKIKIVREYLSWDQEELFDEEKIQHSQISWHCPFKMKKGKWPTRQLKNIYRLVPLLTPVTCPWAVPLMKPSNDTPWNTPWKLFQL